MSKSEFVLMVLTLMNKVEEKDIMLVGEVFEKLDNGKGSPPIYHILWPVITSAVSPLLFELIS